MTHTHRPCCWLVLFLSLGIVIGHILPFRLLHWLIVSLSFGIFSFFSRKTWPLYAAIFSLGAALIHVAHPCGINICEGWRQQLEASLYRYLDTDEAGTMSAIVLGDRGHIPKEIKMIFQHTGTGHILVIAGLHMSMMTAMVFFVLKLVRIPRLWQMTGSVMLVMVFAILTGGSIPVMRAAFMASVVLASFIFEHEGDSLNSLCLAAMVLLLMKAQDLFDTGFQLSFAAVAAILIFCRPIEKRLSFMPKAMASVCAVSTAAWMGITPFQLWHFGTTTPIALAANIFIVPLLDITVALGLSLALAGLWLPWMASSLAGCLKAVFNLMVVIAYWFSQIPFGYVQFR